MLAQVWNPPRLVLGIAVCSRTVWDQYVLQSDSRSFRMPSVFHAPGAVVWPCRPAEAACYSKWLCVTVVSIWPRIRNTTRLETDRVREEYTWKTNTILRVKDWTHLSSRECFLHKRLQVVGLLFFLYKNKSKPGQLSRVSRMWTSTKQNPQRQ